MRKAALASTLTLLLSLTTTPILTHPGVAIAATAHDAGSGSMPVASDFVFPVGNPRIQPNYDSTDPNGFQITQMFNNSCDPSVGQGYYYAGEYWCGHSGVDLSDRAEGGEVHATAAGVVVYAGYNSDYGEMVRIEHLLPDSQTVYSQYEHMQNGSLQVGTGQVVAMGQTIGYVGSTGFAIGPHLHFEIKQVNEDGPGYSFGNAALLIGYLEPIAFIVAHTQELLPTATPTPVATAAPTTTTEVLALTATAPASSSALASYGGDQQAVLSNFYHQYHQFVTVTADHLNVRAGSGFSYTPLNSVIKGARLGYLGMTGNGWIHVALPDNIYGYVARQWVDGKTLPKLPPIQASGKLKPPYSWVKDARYPARNGPKMHDGAIEVLKVGERLTYLGTRGSWDKVVLPTGRIGWVLNWYLRDPKIHVDLNPPARRAQAKCPCVQVAVDGLNVREGPSLSDAVIESLHKGTRLSIHGYETGWVSVTTPDGHRGFVMVRYVLIVGAASAAQTHSATTAAPVACPCVVTTVDGLNLRQGPRLSAPVLVSLHQGTKLHLFGYHVSWVDVLTPGGLHGYVLGSYVHAVGAISADRTASQGSKSDTSPDSSKNAIVPPSTSGGTSNAAAPLAASASVTLTSETAPSASTPVTTTAPSSTSAARRATDSQQPQASGFAAPFVYVDVAHANVRAAPSLKAIVFVSEPRDTQLAKLGTRGGWVHVETRNGVTGWIRSGLIRPA